MKTELMIDIEKRGDRLLVFWCRGCITHHGIPVAAEQRVGVWKWNGDRERPTLQPSILSTGTWPLTEAEADRVIAGERVEARPLRCHFYLRDGILEYLSDTTHRLSGQNVPLEETG